MSLRLFSDQCVPGTITTALRLRGHHGTTVREVMPIRSLDPEVIAKAGELDAILVSLNGDFSDIVSYPPSIHRGIVSIQLHNHPEIISQLMDRLFALLEQFPNQDFYHGRLILVEVHRVRIRQ